MGPTPSSNHIQLIHKCLFCRGPKLSSVEDFLYALRQTARAGRERRELMDATHGVRYGQLPSVGVFRSLELYRTVLGLNVGLAL